MERQNIYDDDEEEEEENDEFYQCGICELPVDRNKYYDCCGRHICEMCCVILEEMMVCGEYGTVEDVNNFFLENIAIQIIYLKFTEEERQCHELMEEERQLCETMEEER